MYQSPSFFLRRITRTFFPQSANPCNVEFVTSCLPKALTNQAPDYKKNFLHIKTNTTYRLPSQDHNLLAVPRTKHMTFGDRAFGELQAYESCYTTGAFAHSGPFLWNKLPREIRLSPTLAVFFYIKFKKLF